MPPPYHSAGFRATFETIVHTYRMPVLKSPVLDVRFRDPEDDAFIARLGGEAFSEFSSGAREHTLRMAQRFVTLIAVRGGEREERVGFAILEDSGAVVELQAIAVVESERGRGVGRALLRSAEAWARARSASRLRLRTAEANLAALELFVRAGFRLEERLPRHYRRVFDAFVLSKPLRRSTRR